ncbi:hypothetical protein BDZ45DRAFT_608978 [Acephala macrosclerotiorum]|nr:hypothetical protein BDZ45DRAFT_608978 [Acephala macrosclerotiorum]
MGKLVKSHLARLVVLSAATYQVAAAIEGFFWPKVFLGFLTNKLNGLVKPFPALQIVNLLFGLGIISLEWPLEVLAGTRVQRRVKARLFILPMSSVTAALLYQGTDPAGYYLIGLGLYLSAYRNGEKVVPVPWSVPLPR